LNSARRRTTGLGSWSGTANASRNSKRGARNHGERWATEIVETQRRERDAAHARALAQQKVSLAAEIARREAAEAVAPASANGSGNGAA
jgi:hypothetical protein